MESIPSSGIKHSLRMNLLIMIPQTGSQVRVHFRLFMGCTQEAVMNSKIGRAERRSANGEDFATTMHKVHEQVKLKLQESSIKYKGREYLKSKEQSFEVGELVLAHLRKEIFPRGEYNKWKYKKIGPCNILWKFSNNACALELPSDMGILPIFNVAYFYKYNARTLEGLVEEGDGSEVRQQVQWQK